MNNILVVEGRKTIGGGQVVTKAICEVLSKAHLLTLFLPGNSDTPVAQYLRDYRQTYFEHEEFTRGNKNLSDIIKFVKNLSACFKLRRAIKEGKIDLVYIQHINMLPVVVISTIGLNVSIIAHLHIFFTNKYVNRLVNRLLAYNKIRLVIGVSEYTLTQLDKRLQPKCHVLYNTVKLQPLQTLSERNFKIAIIGDVMPAKGQHVLLEAIDMSPTKHEVHVIGNIVDHQYKSRLDEEFPMVNAIFTGIIDDVPQYMKTNGIELTVVASISPFETFSLAMVESWSMGIPTIATNGFGMKELVNRFLPQYRELMLFNISDSIQLCSNIGRLESDANIYNSIAKDCRSVVKKEFCKDIFGESLLSLLAN